MAKVKSELTSGQIASKKAELEAKINDNIEEKKLGRISPAKKFLNEIQDLVKIAIENNVSYKQLSKDILEVYNFKVSEQTIRAFAHNVLGVEKKPRRKNNPTASVEGKSDKTAAKENDSGRVKSNFDDI